MFDLIMTTAFQDVEKADQIRVHIRAGIDQRISHPCLGRQINHPVELLLGKELFRQLPIRHVEIRMTELLEFKQLGQTGLFQLRIVIIIEIIQPDHGTTVFKQAVGEIMADKTGSTGNEYFFAFLTE